MQNTAPLNPTVLDRSRPVVRHPVELATHIGLKTYNRTFPRVEAALFLADVVVHLQGRASRDYAAEIAQVNEAITRELDRLEAFATGETRRIGNVLRKAPVAPAHDASEVGYTRPARVDLTMRTPRARRYAALLADLERAGRALDAAWYAGAVDTGERFDLENLLFRNFMRSCGVFERLARGLARRVRDDAETPGYHDMLVKRTGRGPEATSAPAVAEEGAEEMTAPEAESLQATEALTSALIASPPEPGADAVREGDPEAGERADGGVTADAAPRAETEIAGRKPADGATPSSEEEGATAGEVATVEESPTGEENLTGEEAPADRPAESGRRRLRDALGRAKATA